MVEGMLWGPRPSNLKTKEEQVGSLTGILKDVSKTLAKMQSTIENSPIARRDNSPLETSLAKLVKSTVSFNEKTLRWHDDQTHLMIKNSDPRVAAALTPKAEKIEITEDKMVTEKKTGLGVLAGFLKGIKSDTGTIIKLQKSTRKLIGRGFFGRKRGKSAEDRLESDADESMSAKNEKKQTGFLKGMWESMKEKHKDNWLVKHWGKLLAFVLLLNTKMSTLVKLWESFIKPILLWAGENPGLAVAGALTAYFAGPAFAAALGGAMVAGIKGLFTGGAAAGGGAAGGGGIMTALGSFFTGGLASPGAIVIAMGMALIDGFIGYFSKEKEWGEGGIARFAAGFFSGTSDSLTNLFTNMGKWAVAGATLGSVVPVVGTLAGGLLGAAVGGIFHFIGGERMTQAFKNVWGLFKGIVGLIIDPFINLGSYVKDLIMETDWGKQAKKDWDKGMKEMKENIKHAWDSLIDPFVTMWEGIPKIWDWLVDPKNVITKQTLIDFWEGAIEKIKNMAKSIIGSLPEFLVPDSILKWAGLKETEKPSTTDTPPIVDKEDEKKQVKIKALRQSIAEHEEKIASGDMRHGFSNMWSREESIKKAKKEIKELGGDVGSDTTTTDTGDGGSTDGTKIKKLNAALKRTSAKSLATWRTKGTKHGGERKMEMELMSKSGKMTWDSMTPKEQKRFKLTGDKMGFTAKVGDAPVIEKPSLSDFKVPDYGGMITARTDRGLKRQGDLAANQIKEDVLSGKLPYENARMELEKLAMPDENFVDTKMRWIDRQAAQRGIIPNKLVPNNTPDDKMNTFNSIQKENLTAATQSSSPVMISSVDNSIKSAPKEQTILMEDKIHNSPVPAGVPR